MNWRALYLSPQGRIGRTDFWKAFAILFALDLFSSIVPFLGPVVWLVLVYPWVCVWSKRLHDMGRSAFLMLIPMFVWFVGLGAIVAMLMQSRTVIAGGGGGLPPGFIYASVAWLILNLVNLAFLAWVGAAPTRIEADRFGATLGPIVGGRPLILGEASSLGDRERLSPAAWFLSAEGRIGRPDFWFGYLAVMIVGFVIGMFAVVPMMTEIFQRAAAAGSSGAAPFPVYDPALMKTMMWPTVIYAPFQIYVTTCLAAKRLHDAGKSAWRWTPFVALSIASVGINVAVTQGLFGPASPSFYPIYTSGNALLGLVLIGGLIWAGVITGQIGANAYGPPRISGLSARLFSRPATTGDVFG